MGIEINTTALYREHLSAGAKIIEFGGWRMPVYYTNVIEEHNNTRNKASLFDTCHMGEISVEGQNAAEFLQKILTNNIDRLSPGKAFYSHMCLPNGGIIDDLFVYMFSDRSYMLVVNAANTDKDFRWLVRQKEGSVRIFDRSRETAKIDLQGPSAAQILKEFSDIKRFCFAKSKIKGIPCLVSRTGYTGEDGFEIYFNGNAAEMWNGLLIAGEKYGLKPAGLGARDTLRIEAGYSLYGHELSESINPLEAGVGFAVKFDKDFIGRSALEEIKKQGVKRKIVAFRMNDRGIPRAGYKIFMTGAEVGYVTSGTMSPTFRIGLGMAFVEKDKADIGNEIHIKIREKLYSATIENRPIYQYKGGG